MSQFIFKSGFIVSLCLLVLALTGCGTTRRIDSQVQSVQAAVPGALPLQGASYRFERLPSQVHNPAAGLAEQQAQLAHSHRVSQHGHALRWFGQHFEQHRLTSAALIIVVMLLTIFAVQHFGLNNNLENSDAFLLASDLPPEAYADKGFDAWLDSN